MSEELPFDPVLAGIFKKARDFTAWEDADKFIRAMSPRSGGSPINPGARALAFLIVRHPERVAEAFRVLAGER